MYNQFILPAKTPLFYTVASCCQLGLMCGAIIQIKSESRRDENQQLSTKIPQACSCCSSTQQLIIKDRFKIDSLPVGNFDKHSDSWRTYQPQMGPKVECFSFLSWAKRGLRGTWRIQRHIKGVRRRKDWNWLKKAVLCSGWAGWGFKVNESFIVWERKRFDTQKTDLEAVWSANSGLCGPTRC